jgi:glutamate 5-kinase
MVTKLRAAETVTRAGGHVVLANGKRDSVLDVLAGAPVGTHFGARGGVRAHAARGLDEPEEGVRP